MNVQDMLQTLDGYFRNNQVDKVEPFLLDHLNQAMAAQDYSSVLTILNELMGFYRGMSRFAEAISTAQRALSLLESLGYKGSIPYATTLLNAATAYRADGQTQRAIAAYEEVMAIYENKKVGEAYLIASLYNNMSLAYQELGDHAQAIDYLQRALPLVQSLGNSEVEVAVTYTNLAQSKIKGGRLAEAREDLQQALRLFESQPTLNSHYGAALAALGEIAYREHDSHQAIAYYERALANILSHYGKNMYYAVTLESLALVYEDVDKEKSRALQSEARQIQVLLERPHDEQTPGIPISPPKQTVQESSRQPSQRDNSSGACSKGLAMKGLALARSYYDACKEQLLAPYPAYRQRIAAGLVGLGSECFGFDDDYSRDHDFGPSFCLWLTEADYNVIGQSLQAAYEALPAVHEGVPARTSTGRSGKRVGVFSIPEFYTRFLGAPQLPISDADWLQIPEELLASAVNGEVFEDPLGEFTAIRQSLQNYYPQTIQRLKIATAVAKMAQSGQYNLPRAVRRQEMATALLAQAEFIRQTCALVYAINGRYTPVYKWLHRGIKTLPRLSGLYGKIDQLSRLSAGQAQPLVEDICMDALSELIAQGYTQAGDAFLETHVDTILGRVNITGNTNGMKNKEPH